MAISISDFDLVATTNQSELGKLFQNLVATRNEI
jgi:hypothetical protein